MSNQGYTRNEDYSGGGGRVGSGTDGGLLLLRLLKQKSRYQIIIVFIVMISFLKLYLK